MKKNSKIFLVLIIFLVFYVAFVFYSDISKVTESFYNMNLIYLPAILITSFIAFTIRSKRQGIFLKQINSSLTFKENFFLYFSGLSMIVTPGGAGEAIKAQYLKKKNNTSRSKSIPVFLFERMHDFLGITSFLVITFIFYQLFSSLIILIISGILLSTIFFLFKNNKILTNIFNRLDKFPIIKNIPYKSNEFIDSTNKLFGKKVNFQSWIITMISMIFDGFAIYFSFLSFGIDMNYFLSVQMAFSSILFGALSFLPGGIGITEGSLTSLLVENNIALSTSSAIVILLRLTTLWFATGLGFLFTKIILKDKIN